MWSIRHVDHSIFLHWLWPSCMHKSLSKRKNVSVNERKVWFESMKISFFTRKWIFFSAAAKLANATRGHKNLPMTSPPINQEQKLSLASSIIHPTNSSLKYSASNGSGADNFSTDDADETFSSRAETSKTLLASNLIKSNRFNQCRKSDMSTSQMSFSVSVDENKRLSISKSIFMNNESLSLPFSQWDT